MASRRPDRRGVRIFVALLLLAAMAGLDGTLIVRLTSDARATMATLDAQREGVFYLRPLRALQTELVSARFAAVRGQRVNVDALSAAVTGVAQADRAHGTVVAATQRWSDLRKQIEGLLAVSPSGRPALQAYTDVLALAAGLSQHVATATHLIAQEDLDGHYLAEAVSNGLPRMMAAAGLAADEAYLTTTADRSDRADGLMRVALARYQVSQTADEVLASIGIAFSATDSGTLNTSVTGPLDALGAAVGQLSAPAAVRPEAAAVDVAALTTGAESVRVAGASLTNAILTELDALVTVRLDQTRVSGVWAWGVAIAGGLVGLVLLWWSVPAAVTRPDDDDAHGDAPDRDVAAISMRLPEIDPRELLASEELVHVGRGVRSQHRTQDDHAG
ncbi:MAG: hypothetical protein QOE61_4257, partial [Micromonosporaceae bacterium]|jgi:hypothetical protein|nr:hypothetical protein [Micromonosporaceae bacterium]